MPTELFYIYFINSTVACQPGRTVARPPNSAVGDRAKPAALGKGLGGQVFSLPRRRDPKLLAKGGEAVDPGPGVRVADVGPQLKVRVDVVSKIPVDVLNLPEVDRQLVLLDEVRESFDSAQRRLV